MMNKKKRTKKIYLDRIIAITVTVLFAVFFTWKFQESSSEKVLNTLSEISDQSVNVIQEEVDKNKMLLINLAIYISQGDIKDVDQLIERLEEVDRNNGFKRMGIISDNGYSKATDGTTFVVGYDSDGDRFRLARDGKTTVSDCLEDLADGEDITLYTTPINWPDGTRYVLFGTYRTESYKDTLSVSTFEGEGYSYIIKKSGECVIDSQHKNGLSFDNLFEFLQEPGNSVADVEQLRNDFQAGKSGFISYETGLGNRYMYYQPLSVNDWYFLSVIPGSVVETQINGTIFYAYAALLVFIIGTLYLVFRMYKIQISHKKVLMRAAYVDGVTGGATYAKFKLDFDFLQNKYEETKYAVTALNIQRFQYINDLYGYEEGDAVLNNIVSVLNKEIGENECTARIQADHFLILLAYATKEELTNRIEMILSKIQEVADKRNSGTPYVLKLNAGVYLVEQQDELIELMADRAFAALRPEYNAEMNPCNFYDDTIRSQMLKSKEIEDNFADALANKEFYLCYQPKYCVSTRQFNGAEALVRWQSAGNKIISPGEFIPILEHSGGIVELDEYVLKMACEQIRQWLDKGYIVLPISVNVSQLHLYRLDFVEKYLEIISRYGIPHCLIQLEITETALFENKDILSESLSRFRKEGIHILMDDFGTGYSSVGMLKSMPIDTLKIDKSMIDPLEESEKSRRILESIIKLAQSLNISVTAEGVERKEQYDILHGMEVDYIQGYYCARPMSVEEYVNVIQEAEK